MLVDKELGEFAIQICDPKRIGTFIPTYSPFKRWEFEIHDDDDIEEFSSDENIKKLLSPWLKPEEYKILRKAIYQFHSVLANEFQKDNWGCRSSKPSFHGRRHDDWLSRC